MRGNVPNDIAAPYKVANKKLRVRIDKSSLGRHLPWNRMRCNRESLPRKQNTKKKKPNRKYFDRNKTTENKN